MLLAQSVNLPDSATGVMATQASQLRLVQVNQGYSGSSMPLPWEVVMGSVCGRNKSRLCWRGATRLLPYREKRGRPTIAYYPPYGLPARTPLAGKSSIGGQPNGPG